MVGGVTAAEREERIQLEQRTRGKNSCMTGRITKERGGKRRGGDGKTLSGKSRMYCKRGGETEIESGLLDEI